MKPTAQIWMDGQWTAWEDAKVHILTHALHYGTGVFEGIRAYESATGKAGIFRLGDHIHRLHNSAKVIGFTIPFAERDLSRACEELIARNQMTSAYIRPLVYVGYGVLGVYAPTNPIQVAIAAWDWATYLGAEGVKNGIRATVASYHRSAVNAWMAKSKTTGGYVNSVLAKSEAKANGYDEAILLDAEGYVSEASGQNVFALIGGQLVTTPAPSVLAGITRDTVIKLAADAKIDIVERRMARDELYLADEVFLTGTASEITPVRSVDRREIGPPGAVTKRLQDTYFKLVRGDHPRSKDWITWVG